MNQKKDEYAWCFKLRKEDKLHFSPNCIFGELDFDNKEKLIRCFRDRIHGFYLIPAKLLDGRKFGFGCGLLCMATIDCLARITFPGPRIKEWLKSNIDEFKEKDFAQRFYKDFRCGLVHEGRIKNPGEFSYESNEIVTSEDGIIRINPRRLLQRLEESVEKYLADLRGNPDAFNQFKSALKKDFEEEVEKEKQHIYP